MGRPEWRDLVSNGRELLSTPRPLDGARRDNKRISEQDAAIPNSLINQFTNVVTYFLTTRYASRFTRNTILFHFFENFAFFASTFGHRKSPYKIEALDTGAKDYATALIGRLDIRWLGVWDLRFLIMALERKRGCTE